MKNPTPTSLVRLLCAAVLLVVGCAEDSQIRPSDEASAAPPFVAAFERLDGSDEDVVTGGRLLWGELGCRACHAPAAVAPAHHRAAPRLDGVGGRLHSGWLRRFVADPHGVRPATPMPDLLGGLTAAERERRVESITHFLASLGDGPPPRIAPDRGAARRGDALYHTIGCVACHAPRSGSVGLAEPSVPLPAFEDKWGVEALAAFLREPSRVRPSGRMPDLRLTDREARDIAHFLLAKTRVRGALEYEVWRGRIDALADDGARARQELWRTGLADGFDAATAGLDDAYRIRFSGFLRVETAGEYDFHVSSDDGTRLRLDGELVLDNDGSRNDDRPRAVESRVTLAAGWRSIELEYFQRWGEQSLAVEWAGPGRPRGPIPPALLASTLDDVPSPSPLRPDPVRVDEGRELFETSGCASCHAIGDGPLSPLRAPPRDALDPEAGCLAPRVGGNAPRFALDPRQKRALRAWLGVARRDGAASPSAQVHRTLAAFDCLACHERDGVGGPSEERESWFESSAPDQGLEGRIPPRLTGVGAKLREPWLARVLADGASVRPHLLTRMPRYRAALPEDFAAVLAAADGASGPSAAPSGPASDEVKEAGRVLVGAAGGLNCVACHHFNGREAASMQMVDLTQTTDRLRYAWFSRFLPNPAGISPETRMPGFTGAKGVLGDDLARQVDAIWTYLADGRRALEPDGVSRQPVELRVGGEAIIYRGKLRDVGFRGIAVGHPELVHLAFDAEGIRIATIWKGRFLDAGPHWRSQGMGRIGPLGHDVLALETGVPFARLAAADAPWPTALGRDADHRFRGYRLGALRRPTFLYDVGDVRVEDFTRGREEGGEVWLERRITMTADAPPADLVFRVAAASRIEAVGAAEYAVGDRLRVRVTSGAEPRLRDSGGRRELLQPVRFEDGRAELDVEYRW